MPYQHRAALASVVALVLLTISGAADPTAYRRTASKPPHADEEHFTIAFASAGVDPRQLPAGEPSQIVVLPLRFLTPEPRYSDHINRITEDLLAALSKVSELEVISSHAPLDQGPEGWTEGPEQGARYVLQVRLQKGADRFYANFRLFDAEQGRNVLNHNVEGSLEAIDLLSEIITRELMRVLELSVDTDAAP